MSHVICERCGDTLRYIGAPFNRWIHVRLPIAQAWTHEARPAGSGGGSGAAGAPVPARPRPPTLSGEAAAELKFSEDEPA